MVLHRLIDSNTRSYIFSGEQCSLATALIYFHVVCQSISSYDHLIFQIFYITSRPCSISSLGLPGTFDLVSEFFQANSCPFHFLDALNAGYHV